MWVVDANSVLYRSFHGIPMMNRASDGMPTNALYGLARQLIGVRRDAGQEPIIVVFDHPGGSFREKIWPDYKKDRKRPDEFVPQAAMARKMTVDLGFPVIEQPGFEADDTIAHLVKIFTGLTRGADEGLAILTGDKDMLQLVDDSLGVTCYDPWKQTFKDGKDCIAKFGVGPRLVPDVQALMGDPVDGIPGVPGIGPKKAGALIKEHGSIDRVLQFAKKQSKGVMWANIRTAGDDLYIWKQLAELSTNTPLTERGLLDLIASVQYNEDTAQAALDDLGFASLKL